MTERVLLVGPSPPPNVGPSKRFRLFCDYLVERDRDKRHVEVLCIRTRGSDWNSFLNQIRHTASRLSSLASFVSLGLRSDRIIVFGSNRSATYFGALAVLVFVPLGKRVGIRVFGGDYELFYARLPPLPRMLIRGLLGRSHHLVVQPELSARALRDVWPETLCAVGNYNSLPADCRRRAPSARISFLYTGRFTREKGCFELLRAFRQVRKRLAHTHPALSVQLDFYGVVEFRIGGIPKEESPHGDPDIRMHGDCDPEVVMEALGTADVFVFPTYYPSEGHSGSVIEAMMAGLPVITTHWRAMGELVEDGVSGLMVEPHDADSLAEAMYQLAMDPTLRERLSKEAVDASRRFDTKVVLPQLAAALGVSC